MSIATSDNRSSAGAQSVLARDWTVTAHEVCYATGEGKLLLDEVTAVIPGSSACALVGPSVADKGALLRLLGGAARGGYFSGRVAFGGQPHHEASLLCVFAEAPPGGEGEARSLLGGGGGGRVEGSLSPAEAVAFAAALRFGADAADARDRGATMARALGLDDAARQRAAAAKGLRFARGAASRAEAVVARVAVAAVHGPPVVCVEDPFRGLAGGECLVVAGALEALAARGHTVIASLDSDGLSEAAFEAAFSRSVVLRNGRVLYCGETRRAAAHCARCFADGDGARFGRLDVLERVGGDARLAAACARSFARTPESRRAEQEAAHVEPLDEERGALHWLAPPVVAPAARFRTLVYRDLARHGRPFGVAVAERHAGAVAVALLWGVAFWDVAAVGADHLSAWALTSVAFASGNVVVAAMLASAPQLCRRHGDFERDRRAGRYGALEHVAARSALLVLESACVAVAPTALYLMAGLPFGCVAFVYALGALLAFACGCCIEALAAWAHSPPPADARGGGGGDFAPDRAAAAAADRVACGAFGALASCMVLSTGFGVELNDFRRGNPFFWHARANHLRWYAQGVALRVRASSRYHDGGVDAAAGGWRRYAAVDSLWALLALAAAARLASYYYLTLRPPSARHVDAKKLATWATRPKLDADDAAEALDAAAKNPLGLARDKGAVAVPPRVAPERSNERSARAFSRSVDAAPVSLAADGVTVACCADGADPKTPPRKALVLEDLSLAVAPREAILVAADDPLGPRCLLRVLAARDARKSRGHVVAAAGRVAVNGAPRPRDWRSRCAFLAAGDARCDGFLSLSARETVALALGLAHGRAVDAAARAEDAGAEPLAGYRARTPEGALAPPPTAAAAAAWLDVVLDVAGVARQAQLGPVAYGGGGDESPALHRRRVALACELARAPVVVLVDDLTGGARSPACGARDACAPRDAAALARTYAHLAQLGCTVVATAHGAPRDVVLAFDRVALLRGPRLAYDGPPRPVCDALVAAATRPGSADAARVSRDATLRPLDAALEADLKLLAAPASAGPGGALKTPEESEPMGAAAILRPTFRVGVLAQAAALLRRDLAAARADRGMLGAAIGAPLANAALLCGAFWGQGHDDARSVLWLNYCLLAAFATPAALQFPRHAALARAFEHERAAGLVGAPAFFLASLAAPLPLTLLRALLVVPVVYAAANFVVDGAAVAVAVLACGAAGLAAQALALACCWAYVAQTNASALGLGAPDAARRRALAIARAGDAAALLALSFLMYCGFFRFVRDLDAGWRGAADADFARWLLQAMSTPQLRDKAAPGRYETDGGANFYADARRFVGYSHGTTADGALLSGVVYGPVVLTAVALLGLFRLLYVQRH